MNDDADGRLRCALTMEKHGGNDRGRVRSATDRLGLPRLILSETVQLSAEVR